MTHARTPAPTLRTQASARRRTAWHGAALATAALTAACGGDGGSATAPGPSPSTGVVAVTAALGAIVGADVSVVCAPTGATLGSGSTGSDGRVSVATTGDCSGPVLVTVSGRADGSSLYFDEGLASPALLPAGSSVRALAPALTNPLTLAVTPLTEIAARQAIAAAGSLAALGAAQVTAANTAVVPQVLGAGVTLDILAPPTPWTTTTVPGSFGNTAADRYAFYLGALARMGLGTTAPALAVTGALAADLVDGALDGGSSGSFSYTPASLPGQLTASLTALASYADSALLGALGIAAATPVAVTSVTPISGAVGSTVTVAGSGFDADPARMRVRFGGDAIATVVSSTTTSLVVQVPAGAASGPLTITNLATSLGATSDTAFTVTGGGGSTVPAVPSGLSATPTSSSGITLAWSAAVGATAYHVYRATAPGVAIDAGHRVTPSPVESTVFADTGLAAGTTYHYTVTSVNAAGESVGATEASAATLAAGALIWTNAEAQRLSVGYDRAFFLNGRFMTVHAPGVIRSSTDGNTWTTAQTGTSDTLKEIVFGNGRYVASAVVAVSGRFDGVLRTSSDGVSWSTPTLPVSTLGRQVTALGFGNGRFIAIVIGSGFADVLSSADGVDWSVASTPSFWPDANTLAWGNGVWVAIGAVVQVSTDGVTWTMPITSIDRPNSLRFLNGRFVAVGPSGVIRSSADGVTWTTATSGTTRTLNDVAWGNGVYTVAGSFNALTGTATLLSSPDGVTWTLNDLGAVAPTQNLNGMAFGNGRFLSAGSLGALIVTP